MAGATTSTSCGSDINDPVKTGNWTHGLFGCFSNPVLCLPTFIVPCITFGRMAASVGDDCCTSACLYMLPGINCLLESEYRETIRMRRGIMDSELADWLSIVFCPCCALTQEAAEVKIIQAQEKLLEAQITQPGNDFTTTTTDMPDEPYYPPARDTVESIVDEE